MGIQSDLSRQFEEAGYMVRFAPVNYVSELENEILRRVECGEIDSSLYQKHMNWFEFDHVNRMSTAETVMIVSFPHNASNVDFLWKGKTREFIIPPTYIFNPYEEEMINLLREAMSAEGYSLARAALPEKLLAARTGLARYGRNNITYIPKAGSYHRLVALYTDMPCEEYVWQNPSRLDECENCSACMRRCPTGCIREDLFLINASRCLTYFNENSEPFPAWVNSEWHNAIVGCLKCQSICPANPKLTIEKSGVVFSEEEVKQIIAAVPEEDLSSETKEKLESLCLLFCYPIIGRNLEVLLSLYQ